MGYHRRAAARKTRRRTLTKSGYGQLPGADPAGSETSDEVHPRLQSRTSCSSSPRYSATSAASSWKYGTSASFARRGLDVRFVQDNHSRSRRNTLRGLHYQLRQPQGKLVRVLERGDLRRGRRPAAGSPHSVAGSGPCCRRTTGSICMCRPGLRTASSSRATWLKSSTSARTSTRRSTSDRWPGMIRRSGSIGRWLRVRPPRFRPRTGRGAAQGCRGGRMKVAVLGAGGQLGQALLATTARRICKSCLSRVLELDITDAAPCLSKSCTRMRPELVINAAAYTQVDAAESEPNRRSASTLWGPACWQRWHGCGRTADSRIDGFRVRRPWF